MEPFAASALFAKLAAFRKSDESAARFLAAFTARLAEESARALAARKSSAGLRARLPALRAAEQRYLQAKEDREPLALELQRQHLAGEHQRRRDDIALALQRIQAGQGGAADRPGLMGEDEIGHLLGQAQSRHRLLLILSEPEVSPSCPPSFIHDFPFEARAEVKQFVEQAFPQRSELWPVEFFGKFFKQSAFDAQAWQLQNLLGAVPTVVLHSSLTDEKLYLHLHAWGLPEPVAETFAWNWDAAREALERQGMTERQALREIRKTVVCLYQWFAALLADVYYLAVNPLHEPRLLRLAPAAEIDALAPFLAGLSELRWKVRKAYEEELEEAGLPPLEHIHGWLADQAQDLQRRNAEALRVPVFFHDKLKSGAAGPTMAVIPAGSFTMGSPRNAGEGPQHHVAFFRPFAIGIYPVTFDEYDRYCETTKRPKPGDNGWGRGDRPLINVSWEDAVAYCAWLSAQTGRIYRLPSEAEWEYACRAGTSTPFWTGGAISTWQANRKGDAKGEYREKTMPVGEFAPNPFGLYQMHGNVQEWCADIWHADYQGAPQDGSAWKAGGDANRRVLRGGAWNLGPDCLRSAYRHGGEAGERDPAIGFRLARTLSL